MKTLYKIDLIFSVSGKESGYVLASYGYDISDWSIQRIARLIKRFKGVYPESTYDIEIKEKADDSIAQ